MDVVLLFVVFLVTLILWRWLQSRSSIPSFHTRYILVTGCDSGFGRNLVLRLDSLGFHVFAGCLTSSGAQSLARVTSDRVRSLVMDVTKDDDIDEVLRTVVSALPDNKGLWAVVNNAGIMGAMGLTEMLTRKDFLHVLEVNLLSMAEVTRKFLPLVRRERGRVVNMASVVGRAAVGPVHYVASKFAVIGYTDALRRELYNQGVTVHCLLPGAYKTDISSRENVLASVKATFHRAPPYVQKLYGQEYLNKCEEKQTLAERWLFGTNIEEVVDAYVHALTSQRPSTHYVIGGNANFFFRLMWLLPYCISDWIGGSRYQTKNVDWSISDL